MQPGTVPDSSHEICVREGLRQSDHLGSCELRPRMGNEGLILRIQQVIKQDKQVKIRQVADANETSQCYAGENLAEKRKDLVSMKTTEIDGRSHRFE